MKKLRFLLVDDSPFLLVTMKDQLTAFVDCDTAESGEEAVKMFKQHFQTDEAYDVILLDIVMPQSGIEALNEIRKFERENDISKKEEKVKIIMLSALYKGNVVIDTMLAGDADEYIVKPFTLSELRFKLDSLGVEHNISTAWFFSPDNIRACFIL